MNVNMRSATAVALLLGLPCAPALAQTQPSDDSVATLEKKSYRDGHQTRTIPA